MYSDAPDIQESQFRCGFPHGVLGNRSIARDFLAIHAARTLQQTRLLDLVSWARLPDPPVRAYPLDLPD
eukprot:6290652-Pyramimonas_sp.AAC.1